MVAAKADRSHGSQTVFGEATLGVAYGTDQPCAEVREPAKGVGEHGVDGVPGEGVDGQVAAREVLLELAEEHDLARAAAVVIGAFTPEGRELDGVALVAAARQDRDRSMLDPGRNGLRK